MEQNQTNIECKLIREGGTRAEIGGIEYHFAPQPDGAHVAGVANPDHVDRFLSITDAYRLYRGDAQPVAAPVVVLTPFAPVTPVVVPPVILPAEAPAPVALAKSTKHPDNFDIGGKTYTLAEVTTLAQNGAGMNESDWAELTAETRADLIDETLDTLAASTDDVGSAPPPPDDSAAPALAADADRQTLSAAYKAKFNKPPHYRWSTDKIREALAE